ncbi:O-antigen ligase family protein [Eubacterium sp. OM08-24]|jgi:O-antigen ligase|uniref:O-antigen ligase family protein n=1 Tax=Eubacterium sp. OM08-24 TaxID=2292352 RepID=UPI000E44BB2D|nr:O-antigen ligase family protein [Eubacterium sp. OM08-24]RGM20955.1 O-antigen ligase family protein [Eubacterium sp. OM08-24]
MKKLMNQRWFIALVFMVLYKPAMFSQMPALHTFDTISNVFKVMVIAVLGVWFFYFYQKVSLFFVGIVFFEVWRVLATIYCGGNYTSLFLAIFNALAICLVVEMGLKTDPDALLDGASFTLGLFVLINFATIILFPQGMYEFNNYTQNYFLGYRNNSIMLFFPAIIFSIVRSLRKYNKLTLSSFVITAVSFATVILAFSATSVIGMTVFTLFLLLALINKMPNFLNIITYLAINIAYFFGVIILRLQEAFAFIIVDMLGRDLTFTGRTKIWDSALAAFAKSPVFGVGEIENQASRDLIGATHAHNYYLDLLYKSGLPGFLIFFAILIICGVALYRNRKNGKIPFVVSGAICAFMIMLQSEAYYNIYYFFSILTLAAFIPYALPKKDEDGNFIFEEKEKHSLKKKHSYHYYLRK